jgi:hypothetical protein
MERKNGVLSKETVVFRLRTYYNLLPLECMDTLVRMAQMHLREHPAPVAKEGGGPAGGPLPGLDREIPV